MGIKNPPSIDYFDKNRFNSFRTKNLLPNLR